MNAVLGSINIEQSSIINRTHPPILGTMEASVDGTLEEGLILAKDGTGKVVPYDPAGAAPLNAPVGVLVHDLDTTKDDAAVVLKHGIAVRDSLRVGADVPDAADIAALEAIGVYAQ